MVAHLYCGVELLLQLHTTLGEDSIYSRYMYLQDNVILKHSKECLELSSLSWVYIKMLGLGQREGSKASVRCTLHRWRWGDILLTWLSLLVPLSATSYTIPFVDSLPIHLLFLPYLYHESWINLIIIFMRIIASWARKTISNYMI